MLKEIVMTLGLGNVIISSIILVVIVFIAINWIVYFIARSWSKGIMRGKNS